MKLVQSSLLILLTLSIVSANLIDGKDQIIKPPSIDGVVNFFLDYVSVYKKFRHRKYHRPTLFTEPGPLKYKPELSVRAKREENIISDLWNTFWSFLSSPNEKSFFKIFAVVQSYSIIPLLGGFAKAEAYAQVQRDPSTWSNARVSEDYLFLQLMQTYKITFWKIFGLLN